MASKQKESSRKFVLIIIALIVALYIIFKVTIGANVKINSETYYFYVSETTPSSAVADTLKERGFIRSRLSLKIMAWISSIDTLKPGMYELKDGWSNFKLLNHFGKHKPKPTQFITLPESNSRRSLIVSLCKGTGIHPDDVWKRINDEEFTNKLGNYSKESIFCIFLPRNYRIYKKTDAEKLLIRLHQESLLFWNAKRLKQAEEMRLTPNEVYILASIVYAETKIAGEMSTIAGVYLNRIQKGMRLESDPTLIFAKGKLATKRVHFKDKDIDSPYNTYKNKGLPPGPICTPPSWVIDKVLEFEGHDYLYFCANPDFSGNHLFAETFEEHKENAQRYRSKLDKQRIF